MRAAGGARVRAAAAGMMCLLLAAGFLPLPGDALAQTRRCPVVGGTAVTGTNAESATINPLLRVDTDGDYLSSWVFDRVVDVDPQTFEPIPWLAESWEVSRDGTTYTFRFRRGVNWHDGKPFTARDVEFTLKAILAPGYTGPFRSRFDVIAGAKEYSEGRTSDLAGVRVLDELTLQVRLSRPLASFLATSMRELKPIPQHLIEGQDIARGEWARRLVGTGPFKLREWVRGDHWTFEANTDYWRGRPCLDRIRHQIIPDLNALLVAAETGQVDTVIVPPVTEIPRLKRERKLDVIELPPAVPETIQFNVQDPILKDVRIRHAIAHAIDVPAFTRDVLKGVTQPATSVAVPSIWVYDPSIRMPEYNPRRARQLLAEAGYPGGFTLKWVTNSGNLFREQFTTFVQAQLAQVGIKLEPTFLEWPIFLQTVTEGRFQSATQTTTGGLPDPDIWYFTFRTGAPGNYFRFSNTLVDQLLEQGRTLTSQADRKKVYLRVARILATQLPVFFAYYRPNPIVKNPKLKGLTPQSINPYFQIETWYKER